MVCTQTGTLISCDGLAYDGIAHPEFGRDELGHLMTICENHVVQYQVGSWRWKTREVQYPDAWRACYKVREQWLKSEAHRKLIEAQEQETRDLKHVEDFVKGLE